MIRSKSKNIESFKDLSNHHSSKIKITSWHGMKNQISIWSIFPSTLWGEPNELIALCLGSFWNHSRFMIHVDYINPAMEMQTNTLYLSISTKWICSLGVPKTTMFPVSKPMDPSHSSMNDWWNWSTFRVSQHAPSHHCLGHKPESSRHPWHWQKTPWGFPQS